MSSFRFLHAADLHLDSALRGLTLHDGLSTERIRDASRRALDNMVNAALLNDVAFVIIAGDLYDSDWKSISTGHYLAAALGKLVARKIRVFLLQGNHDAASVLTNTLPLPPGIDRFPSQQPGSFKIEALGVALHGQGFSTRHVADDMTVSYPSPLEGYFNIGVLHTSLSGHGQHETYAPCTPESLRAKRYDYWALGHIHERTILRDGTPIVYPGVLQGRHIRETGEKGVILVTVENRSVTSIDPIVCDVVRWHESRLDCTGVKDEAEFHRCVGARFQEIAKAHEGLLCVTRLRLHGETVLHPFLINLGLDLRRTVQNLASMSGSEIELEKLVLETCLPAITRGRRISDEEINAADELDFSTLIHDASQDEALLLEIGKDLQGFINSFDLGEIAVDSLLHRITERDWKAILPDMKAALCERLTGKRASS